MTDKAAPVVTYSREVMARLLDMTPRNLSLLTQNGHLPKKERARYELVPVVQAYIRYLRARAVKGDLGESDFASHKARLTRAQADLAELAWQQAKGNVLPRPAVLAAWQQVIAAARAKLLALPTKSAGRVLSASSLPEVEAILQEHIHEALAELARADGIPADGSVEGLAAPAEAHGQPVGGPVPPVEPRGERRARPVAHQPRRVPARDSGRAQ